MKEKVPAAEIIEDVVQESSIESASTPEKFITPDLDGLVDKIDKSWVVSVPIPSIEHARIIKSHLPEKFHLTRGKQVIFDLITQVQEDENRHFATHLREYRRPNRSKPPKQK